MLELSLDGDAITGTLDGKTKLSVSSTSDAISLQYKRSASTTNVMLALDQTGNWISGEAKSGKSTSEWFGCRQDAVGADDAKPADFSGHWLLSWGIMQLTQEEDQIEGRYGADNYGKIDGEVVGRRLNLRWQRHRSSGKLGLSQSPDGRHLIGRTVDTEKPSTVVGIRVDQYTHHPRPVAGETVRGISDSGMLYHLRMPNDWKPGKPVDVVVLLHGSNFTTAGMVSVVASKWPGISNSLRSLGSRAKNGPSGVLRKICDSITPM